MKEIRWTRALGLGLLTHAAVRICAARGIDAIRVRYLWQLLQPFDPLRSKGQAGLPEIDVLVPAHPKDVRVLKYCIAAVRGGSTNRIRRISVIVPDDAVDSVRAELPAGC